MKKDNVQEPVNSEIVYDNAGVGYMYGNRDGIIEGSTENYTDSYPVTRAVYYAKEYIYDAAKDRFTLKDPVVLLGTEITEDYVGWYTLNNINSDASSVLAYKVMSVEPSDGSSAAKVGYSYVTYGTTSREKAQTNTNDSTIKEYVDEWYEQHIKDTEYENYLSDTLFCNDRSTSDTIQSGYTNLGYGSEKTDYNGESRLTCEQQNDRFTVNDEIVGNGDLTYPIGLIDTEEITISANNKNNIFLKTKNNFFTMTPISYSNGAFIDYSHNGSFIVSNFRVYNSAGIRPVINLKPNSLKFGDGSVSNPYRIEE